jgi:hypothetical protein
MVYSVTCEEHGDLGSATTFEDAEDLERFHNSSLHGGAPRAEIFNDETGSAE